MLVATVGKSDSFPDVTSGDAMGAANDQNGHSENRQSQHKRISKSLIQVVPYLRPGPQSQKILSSSSNSVGRPVKHTSNSNEIGQHYNHVLRKVKVMPTSSTVSKLRFDPSETLLRGPSSGNLA